MDATGFDFVAAVQREGTALAAAAARGPSERVRIYPEWSVLDLVAHTGSVHRWVDLIVRTEARQAPAREPNHEREPAVLLRWFTDGLERLVGTLERSRAGQAVWTMAGDQTVGFWRRRMAHETTAHRWDAEDAVGDAGPIELPLALTGIPETLEIHVVRPLAGVAIGGRGERVRLRCTDAAAGWTLTLRADRIDVVAGATDADAELRGPASSVWLALMGRSTPAAELIGDPTATAVFNRVLGLSNPPSF